MWRRTFYPTPVIRAGLRGGWRVTLDEEAMAASIASGFEREYVQVYEIAPGFGGR